MTRPEESFHPCSLCGGKMERPEGASYLVCAARCWDTESGFEEASAPAVRDGIDKLAPVTESPSPPREQHAFLSGRRREAKRVLDRYRSRLAGHDVRIVTTATGLATLPLELGVAPGSVVIHLCRGYGLIPAVGGLLATYEDAGARIVDEWGTPQRVRPAPRSGSPP